MNAAFALQIERAVAQLEAAVRAAGLPRPDLRTVAGRKLKAEARRLAEDLAGVHWWELLEAAEAAVRADASAD